MSLRSPKNFEEAFYNLIYFVLEPVNTVGVLVRIIAFVLVLGGMIIVGNNWRAANEVHQVYQQEFPDGQECTPGQSCQLTEVRAIRWQLEQLHRENDSMRQQLDRCMMPYPPQGR